MFETMEELFYGNIAPMDRLRPRTREQRATNDALIHTEEAFDAKLPNELQDAFEELCHKQVEANSCETAQAFVSGFRLAMRFAAEVFFNTEDEER